MQLDQEAQDRVETISAYSAARASLEGPLQAMPETEEEASGDADQKRELPRRPKVSSEDAIKQRRESLKQEEHKAMQMHTSGVDEIARETPWRPA